MNLIITNLGKVRLEEHVIGGYLTHHILIWNRSWVNRSRLSVWLIILHYIAVFTPNNCKITLQIVYTACLTTLKQLLIGTSSTNVKSCQKICRWWKTEALSGVTKFQLANLKCDYRCMLWSTKHCRGDQREWWLKFFKFLLYIAGNRRHLYPKIATRCITWFPRSHLKRKPGE